ncbi:unnamed protein product, partial [Amoebophrya sp. A120]
PVTSCCSLEEGGTIRSKKIKMFMLGTKKPSFLAGVVPVVALVVGALLQFHATFADAAAQKRRSSRARSGPARSGRRLEEEQIPGAAPRTSISESCAVRSCRPQGTNRAEEQIPGAAPRTSISAPPRLETGELHERDSLEIRRSFTGDEPMVVPSTQWKDWTVEDLYRHVEESLIREGRKLPCGKVDLVVDHYQSRADKVAGRVVGNVVLDRRQTGTWNRGARRLSRVLPRAAGGVGGEAAAAHVFSVVVHGNGNTPFPNEFQLRSAAALYLNDRFEHPRVRDERDRIECTYGPVNAWN